MKFGIYASGEGGEFTRKPFVWTAKGSHMLFERDYDDAWLFQPKDYLVAPKELAQWTK